MNQNVSNNSSWLKLMGTDAKADKSNGSQKGVQVAFSSFLSSQLNKANNLMNPGATSTPKDTAVSSENAKSLLKKVEPTANKLAVKSPERLNTSEAKTAEKEVSTEVVKTVENVTLTQDNVAKPVETTEVESLPNEPLTTDEGTVNMEEVAALLQQLMTTLVELVKETPDMAQKQPLQEQIQLIGTLLNEVNQMKDVKMNAETFDRAKSAIENILMTVSKGEQVQPQVVEMLKQTITEIQNKDKGITQSSFNNVLEGKHKEVSQSVPVATAPVESSENSNTTAKMTLQTSTDATDKKTTVEPQVKAQSTGSEKLDVKVQTTDHKAPATPVNVDFNAKLESAAIAFSKVEVANQVTRVPLQQSIMDQLINSPRMQVKQTEQGTMMTMKLNPEVLGDVEIKMEIVKGVLQAEIKVESMIVKGAIEAGLSDLKSALSDKGYQVESLNVSVNKDGQSHQGQHQQQQNERQGRLAMEELELEKGHYGFEAVINDNQIDYRG